MIGLNRFLVFINDEPRICVSMTYSQVIEDIGCLDHILGIKKFHIQVAMLDFIKIHTL